MGKFCQLYEQYALYKEKVNEETSGFATNLLQYGITEFSLRIVEIDGEITATEKEWLNEMALLNEDNPNILIDYKKN